MSRRAPFTVNDVTRVLKGAQKAGVSVKVWIEQDGRICLVPVLKGEADAAVLKGNEWDTVLEGRT